MKFNKKSIVITGFFIALIIFNTQFGYIMKNICFSIFFCVTFLQLHSMENSSQILEVIPSDITSAITSYLDLSSTSNFLRTCKQLYCTSYVGEGKKLFQKKGVIRGIDGLLQQSPARCLSLSKLEYSTVFHYCVEKNKTSLLQFLVEHESADNKLLRIRLLEASHCDQACYNDVAYNIKAYSDSITNNKNSNGLCSAVKDNNFIVAHALLKLGIPVNGKTNSEEITPLCVASINGYADIVDLLIANGADVEAQDEDGDTPLILASTYGYTESVKKLLAKGALIDRMGFDNETALFCAACNMQIDTIKILIENGADKSLCSNYDESFQWVSSKKTDVKTEILTILNKRK